ncbi:MAG TPA: ATP-binding cassette domain-containing protein [bacterium]
MIEVINLVKHYGEHVGIQDITFNVDKGEVLGFLGPNGAGKTTTMRVLSCYMPPSSGIARICGFDVFEESLEVRKKVGYLPEHPPLYLDHTVMDYLMFVVEIKGVKKDKRRVFLDRAVEKCGLGEVKNRLIANLSKGYKQRVGIAQALIHEPEVLILDEPTIGLDPKQIIEIRELIRALGSDHTIILSTHILQEVTMLCKRVVIINRGRLVAADSREQLSSQAAGVTRVSFKLRKPPDGVADSIRALEGIKDVEDSGNGNFIVEMLQGKDTRELIASTIVKNGWGLLEMKPVSLSLEEIYVKLIA